MPGQLGRRAQVLSSTRVSMLDLWRGTMLADVAQQQAKTRLRDCDLAGDPACGEMRAALTVQGLDVNSATTPADVFL